MQTQIDGPVAVHIRAASKEHDSSVSLDILGGSLWFPRSACPTSLSEGPHKGAVVELRMGFARVGDSSRVAFFPSRLLSVS